MTRRLPQQLAPGETHEHRVDRVLAHGRTAIQGWELLELGIYGPALVLDGAIQSTAGDEACYHEALHMPAQMARPDARRVLLIGGANGASLPRVLLLPALEHVTLVDVDAELHAVSRTARAGLHGTSLEDPRLDLVFGAPDAEVAALAAAGARFDLVIADTPDATEGSYSARLFAAERIGAIRDLLAPGGLFVTQAGQAHPLACGFTARVLATLRGAFADVALYTHNVPSFGTPWCFAIAGGDLSALHALEPATIEARLARLPAGALVAYDGETHRHMLALPRALREALARAAPTAEPIRLDAPAHVVVAG
ncbi:hypothetical protein [Salinarimonas chemoclinalis]|uniref:spermine/spermidine synthase domain-containing protein n=1 Tax=Salinarimonas chemoclinalis TaxID=3241599 RepID=UPI003555E64B